MCHRHSSAARVIQRGRGGLQTTLAVCHPRVTDVFHFRSHSVAGGVARETGMCERSWGARGQSKEDRLHSSA